MAGSLVLVMAIVFILFFSTSVGMLLAGELLVSPTQQPASVQTWQCMGQLLESRRQFANFQKTDGATTRRLPDTNSYVRF